MKVNMFLVVYKTSNESKQPKRLKKNLEKKIMSFPPSGILGTRNGLLSSWLVISSMGRALRPVIAKIPSQARLFFQVLFQPLDRLFN